MSEFEPPPNASPLERGAFYAAALLENEPTLDKALVNAQVLQDITHEQYMHIAAASTNDMIYQRIAAICRAHPGRMLSGLVAVDSSIGQDILRDLKSVHFLARCIFAGATTRDKVLAAASDIRCQDDIINFVRGIATDRDQWYRPWPTASDLDEADRILTRIDPSRDVVKASLKIVELAREFDVPQLAAWHAIQDVTGFRYLPAERAIEFEGKRFKLDRWGRIIDEHFPKFCEALSALPGTVHQVPMAEEDCVLVGYLAATTIPSVNGDMVVIQPNPKSVYDGSLSRIGNRQFTRNLVDAFAEAAKTVGTLVYARPTRNYFDYVAFVYAWAKHRNMISYDWNSNRLKAMRLVQEIGEASEVAAATMLAMDTKACNSVSFSKAMAMTPLNGELWLDLGIAEANTDKRRKATGEFARAVSRNLDLGRGVAGTAYGDGLTMFVQALEKLERLRDGPIDVVGVTGKFDIAGLHAYLSEGRVEPPDVKYFYSVTGKTTGVPKTGTDFKMHPIDPALGPETEARFHGTVIDLSIGKGAKREVKANKTTWLVKYAQGVALYEPTSNEFRHHLDNTRYKLPANMRMFYENYELVAYGCGPRMHQTELLVTFKRRRPTAAVFGGDPKTPDADFLPMLAQFVMANQRRAALSQIGNTWMDFCDKYAVRLAYDGYPKCGMALAPDLGRYRTATWTSSLVLRFTAMPDTTDANLAQFADTIFDVVNGGLNTTYTNILDHPRPDTVVQVGTSGSNIAPALGAGEVEVIQEGAKKSGRLVAPKRRKNQGQVPKPLPTPFEFNAEEGPNIADLRAGIQRVAMDTTEQ